VSGEIYGARGYRGEGKFYYEWSGNRFKLIGMAKIKKRGSE
jgi:hypothetical protein